MISQKEEMRTGTESSGVILHDMIERIYFYFIIFSQKKKWEARNTRQTWFFQGCRALVPPVPCVVVRASWPLRKG
jgi:hypothetical protein